MQALHALLALLLVLARAAARGRRPGLLRAETAWRWTRFLSPRSSLTVLALLLLLHPLLLPLRRRAGSLCGGLLTCQVATATTVTLSQPMQPAAAAAAPAVEGLPLLVLLAAALDLPRFRSRRRPCERAR